MEPTISDVREYWDSRPCNIRHSPAKVGTVEYFEQVEARKYFVEPHIPRFADFARWRGKRVLEIGCGIGTDAANFARAGADYTGVELSSVSLDLAKQRFEVFNLPGRFLVADVESLLDSELAAEQFDLIYSFGVLHHTPKPLRALQQLRRLCDQDGELRIMLYARNSWKAALIEEGFDQPEAQHGCPIAFTYTREEVRELLAAAGFLATEIIQDHIFPYRVVDYVNYEYVKEPWFAAMPDELFRAIERQLGWHLLATARCS